MAKVQFGSYLTKVSGVYLDAVGGAMSNVVGILLTVAMWMGIALAIWGVVEFVMSLTQDMPEKKTKGILLLAGGIILVGVKALVTGLLPDDAGVTLPE